MEDWGGHMTALPQISRFIDSNITEGDFKVALSELRDYLNGLLGEDGTPATAGKKLNLPMSGVLEKTQDCTATSADKGKVFRFTGTSAMTLSLDAAMALGDGWNITVINDSSADLVIDPYAGETIDGQETLTLGAGLRTGIVCDGTRMMTTYRQAEPETPDIQINRKTITSSETFIVPDGVTRLFVKLCGGGGGGGSIMGGSGSSNFVNGGPGGTSSFGSYATATGGSGGSYTGRTVSIGSGSGVGLDVNLSGSPGVAGYAECGDMPFPYGHGGAHYGYNESYFGGIGGGAGGYTSGFINVTPGEGIGVTIAGGGSSRVHAGGSGCCIVEWVTK